MQDKKIRFIKCIKPIGISYQQGSYYLAYLDPSDASKLWCISMYGTPLYITLTIAKEYWELFQFQR